MHTGVVTRRNGLATQPVFDGRSKVYGYELDFRYGPQAFFADALQTAVTPEHRIDIRDAVNFDEIAGHRRALVQFPKDLLLRKFPVLFPAEALTISIPADGSENSQLIGACTELKEYGYELALDGFNALHLESPLLLLSDLVCIDTATVDPAEQTELCRLLTDKGIRTLAGNIHAADALHSAREAGYTYCQGDFFRRPMPRDVKDIPANRGRHLRLLNEVNRPELAYDELETLIKQDVAMTYKLLRFINSAWYGLKQPVDSIRHALVLLGPGEVRLWASMIVLRDIGREKPDELFRRCLIRAKMAEELAPVIDMETRASQLFLVGMFSLIEALMDVPMSQVLDSLPLNGDIKLALLARAGDYGLPCEIVAAYESGQWDALSEAAEAIDLDESVLPELFGAAQHWADQALSVI